MALAVLLLLTSCADDSEDVRADGEGASTTASTAGSEPMDDGERRDRPPPVVARGGDVELTLAPWTYCYKSTCADGAPPDSPPDIGSPDEVEVEFPLDGWTFEAMFRAGDATCGREELADLEPVSGTTHRLVPHGPAGDTIVNLFGRGPSGDVFVTFSWTTPVDGPMNEPAATTSIVADHDGVPDSYGVELVAHHLAATPQEATGSVVVTASNGDAATIELRRIDTSCPDDSSVRFDARLEDGVAAAHLGDPPFTYDVTLVLDGVTYTARATWPDDVDEECSPCVPLVFEPPLPSRS